MIHSASSTPSSRHWWLLAALWACSSGDDSDKASDGVADADTDTDTFELVGSWDNDADQSLTEVASIEGFSHYAVGASLYMSWRLEGDTLSLYLDENGYQEPVGGTEGDEVVTYTRQ